MKYEAVADQLSPEVQTTLYHGLIDAAKKYILEAREVYKFADFYMKNYDCINLMMSIPNSKDGGKGGELYILLADYFGDTVFMEQGVFEGEEVTYDEQ